MKSKTLISAIKSALADYEANVMKTNWNNQSGKMGRAAMAVLVTANGMPYRFSGVSIPGVCQSTETGSTRVGKWSCSVYSVAHHEATTFVAWVQDWDTGESFPQPSWQGGFLWLATKAPALNRASFEAFIKGQFPEAAAKWDAVAAGEVEFGAPALGDQIAAIDAAKLEIERLNAEAKVLADTTVALAKVRESLAWAKKARDNAASRLAGVQAEVAGVSGLDVAKLDAETDAIRREIAAMNDQIAAAWRNAEAKARKAQLGNS